MSLQDEANTVQAVQAGQQTQHSSPMIRISRRLTVICEKVKAVLEKSGWVSLLHTVSRWLLGLSLILTLSVFSYIALYSWVMPSEIHEEDVNFQFSDCPDRAGPCSYPNLTIQLDPRRHHLMLGQPYTIALELELPDSPQNQELGMFMSCLKMSGKHGEQLFLTCRSSLLQFRSSLLRTLETIVFCPLLLCRASAERQLLGVTYTNNYKEIPSSQADTIFIEIKSKFLQIYSGRLRLHPQLYGLRRLMYHHSWVSSFIGILSLITLGFSTFLSIQINLRSSLSALSGDQTESEKDKNI